MSHIINTLKDTAMCHRIWHINRIKIQYKIQSTIRSGK